MANREQPKRMYPSDADGDALQRLADDGNDMARPMLIDFEVVLPGIQEATALSEQVKSFASNLEIRSRKDNRVDLTCSVLMTPTYEAVIEMQARLATLAQPLNGSPDGWGSFGNQAEPSTIMLAAHFDGKAFVPDEPVPEWLVPGTKVNVIIPVRK